MKFNKVKCKVLLSGQEKTNDKYGLSGEWIESSLDEMDVGVLVDENLNMAQQCALVAQKASCRGPMEIIRKGIYSRFDAHT
ncbi:hypothetical protein WISP_90565 [Willisornis vidua]|uniref:Uncharacterized protein n=1 Tax=Willisornis vidua TaxID=1566151 RepID=A0ABQ9D7Q5_9PASS|nr:hypothetical protein WISP_90565 [Willisornis vidua]